MSDTTIAIVRWVLLASAVVNLLQATVLFRAFQRRIYEPWFARSERAGGRVPDILRDERLHRTWPALMAAFCLGMWWYLGTPAGIALLSRMTR